MAARFRIGTAGWAVPKAAANRFPPGASHLERYAARFGAVEINSSFHRPHRPSTWRRWAEAAPEGFRFSVKTPKAITHERRLAGCQDQLEAFLAQAALLGEKLGPILVQLPPSLAFDPSLAEAFFADLRRRLPGPVACEPRHASWFEPAAEALLSACRVARVAADPAADPRAARPGGWPGFSYTRLHGSPRTYYSAYGPDRLTALAQSFAPGPEEAWVIFDNTALGAAADDALVLERIVAAAGAAICATRPAG